MNEKRPPVQQTSLTPHSCFMQFAHYWPRKPVNLITDIFVRDPRVVMEELRCEDPDAHALLSEYIVLPQKRAKEE